MGTIQKGKGANFDTRPNPFQNTGNRPKASASLTEVPDIGKTLDVLLEAGCALLIGRTRDGGAVVLTILDGDQRHRTYCSNAVELQDAFDAMWKMYET